MIKLSHVLILMEQINILLQNIKAHLINTNYLISEVKF